MKKIPILVASAVALLTTGPNFHQTAQAANGALSQKAMEHLCSASAKLKRVAPLINAKLKKLQEEQSKLLNLIKKATLSNESKGNISDPENCPDPGREIEKAEEVAQRSHDGALSLQKTGVILATQAGVSAGRVEEFMVVFARAKNSDNYFCAAKTGGLQSITHTELAKCLSGGANDVKESFLLDPATLELEGDMDDFKLDEEIARLKEGSGGVGLAGSIMDDSKSCALTRGSASYGVLTGQVLGQAIWWGGGILKVGTNFDGHSSLAAGDDLGTSTGGSWTQAPKTAIEHLRRTLTTYVTFQHKMKEAFNDISEQMKRIQRCVAPNHLEDERNPDDLLRNHRKGTAQKLKRLEKDLVAAEANLQRYRKEKGELAPIPQKSGSGETATLAMPKSASQKGIILHQAALLIALL